MSQQGEGTGTAAVFAASRKEPAGKLVRVRSRLSGTKLVAPQLSGDFFLMPPEKLVLVEQFLAGWDVASVDSQGQLERRLEKFLAREGITLSGITAATIAAVAHDAARTGLGGAQ